MKGGQTVGCKKTVPWRKGDEVKWWWDVVMGRGKGEGADVAGSGVVVGAWGKGGLGGWWRLLAERNW